MISEIKTVASRHLATDGANLSLRAVARDMGMVSSALYRYFGSRDDLLTALIIDGYNSIGDDVQAADRSVADRTDVRGRFLAVGHAIRHWALAHPAEYALLYGSPVPGYAAPPETIDAAIRTTGTLARILGDGVAAGVIDMPTDAIDPGVRRDLGRIGEALADGAPPESVGRGTIAWIHVFGAVSFELFGQLNNAIEAREEYFDYQLRLIADLAGFPVRAGAQ
jgi:AcrR family transcriptional regulator